MTTTTKKRTQQRALPWFGADTLVCDQYAARLKGCKHVTVPMCGGLSLPRCLIEQGGINEIICSDAHNLAINLYTCVADRELRADLLERLNRAPFHESLLAESQEMCKAHDIVESTDVTMAFHYFVTAWMGRSGKAGTESEFKGGLAFRWDAGGGSSPLRFQTAVRSLEEVWAPVCERCSFLCRSWEASLGDVIDSEMCGIYCDPPWPGLGDSYRHKFSERDHRALKEALAFNAARVVIRYGDHPLIRDLYGNQGDWFIQEITSRNQSNAGVKELCITNWKPEAN